MAQGKKAALPSVQPSQSDYEALAEFRYLIRRFLEFSQTAAKAVGLTSAQHQALLAIKGSPGGRAVTIGDLAEHLRIRHHSAVELVDRLSAAGLVMRTHDAQDHRRVVLSLTRLADHDLAELSATHLDELARLRPALKRILAGQRSAQAHERSSSEGPAVGSLDDR
jgi:DNA-binding MarR family transcriptional regulator